MNENRDLANDIDRGIWNAACLMGVYVYGFLAIGLLGVAALVFSAKLAALMAAASAGFAWVAQNLQLFAKDKSLGASLTWVAAVAGVTSAALTLIGV